MVAHSTIHPTHHLVAHIHHPRHMVSVGVHPTHVAHHSPVPVIVIALFCFPTVADADILGALLLFLTGLL
jgi:hypothetical protein